MTQNSSNAPMAGGFLIAMSLILGAIIGYAVGQPSAGFVGGLAVGVVAAVLLWVKDRKRG